MCIDLQERGLWVSDVTKDWVGQMESSAQCGFAHSFAWPKSRSLLFVLLKRLSCLSLSSVQFQDIGITIVTTTTTISHQHLIVTFKLASIQKV